MCSLINEFSLFVNRLIVRSLFNKVCLNLNDFIDRNLISFGLKMKNQCEICANCKFFYDGIKVIPKQKLRYFFYRHK